MPPPVMGFKRGRPRQVGTIARCIENRQEAEVEPHGHEAQSRPPSAMTDRCGPACRRQRLGVKEILRGHKGVCQRSAVRALLNALVQRFQPSERVQVRSMCCDRPLKCDAGSIRILKLCFQRGQDVLNGLPVLRNGVADDAANDPC